MRRPKSGHGIRERGDESRLDFGRQVRDAMAHLHDPAQLEAHPLTEALTQISAIRTTGRGRILRQWLYDAIDALRPDPGTPTNTHAWRAYQILTLRYVEAMNVPTTIDRLAISRGEFFRDWRQALEAAASWLWDRWGLGESGRAWHRPLVTPPVDSIRQPAPRAALSARLPSPLTTFVGREREREAVKSLLAEARLVTLTGTGGCGKTRLAVRVASDFASNEVALVELAALSDPGMVAQSVASTLDVGNVPAEAIVPTLVARLSDTPMLLVLDNCEHVVDGCAALAETLLQHCPRLRIMATSREAFGIAGEVCWRVPSLATPDLERVQDMTTVELESFDAVHLFVDRAKEMLPSFRLNADNRELVAQICSRLDGIPLAIELAAARLKVLTVAQIAERLNDRFRLLTGGSRTAHPRQRTLRSAVEWSYGILAPFERTLFNRLSVFAGGFTLEAVEAIGPDDEASGGEELISPTPNEGAQLPIRREDCLDALEQLVDKSLVVADLETGAVKRNRLLETLREYGREQLEAAGEKERFHERHAAYYLGFAAKGAASFHGPMHRDYRMRLEPELDNLRTALRWFLDSGDAVPGLELAASLYNFWWMRGSVGEGRAWIERFLALPNGAERTMARARALQHAGRLAHKQGDTIGGRAMIEEAIAIARELGDRPYAVSIALDLVWILAPDRLPEVVAEYRSLIGDPTLQERVASADGHLGRILYEQGDEVEGRRYAEQGLALARRSGSQYYQAWYLEVLGEIESTSNEDRARGCLLESLGLYRDIGDPGGVASIENFLGRLDILNGHPQPAAEHFRASLRLTRDWDWVPRIAQSLDGLAMVAAASGNAARALRLAGASAWLLESSAQGLLPRERAEQDVALAPAWAALERSLADASWSEGRAMTLEEAIVDALADDG